MGVLFGAFNFSREHHVSKELLTRLSDLTVQYGPDSSAEHREVNVALGHRVYFTTQEERGTSQPIVRDGVWLTWDGRLDNRDELIRATEITIPPNERLSDASIVHAAYLRWKRECLPKILGDWALIVWDAREQSLLLARDYIGARKLYFTRRADGIVWCTIPEALAQMSTTPLHIDEGFLSGFLSGLAPLDRTSICEIKPVSPATYVLLEVGGKTHIHHYWKLSPTSKIRYSSDREYEEHFVAVFSEAVRRRLRADNTVIAELSGGVDSSAIVCIADHLIAQNRAGFPRIETLSYFDDSEPSGDERRFFSLIEKKRDRQGAHISYGDLIRDLGIAALDPLSEIRFTAFPGRFATSLRIEEVRAKAMNEASARVVLSGLGGDELLGGVQYEAPQIADELVSFRLKRVWSALIAWSISRRKNIYSLLTETLSLLRAQRKPELLAIRSRPSWLTTSLHSHEPALVRFADWGGLSPSGCNAELGRYELAVQLSLLPSSLVGCHETRWPMLDQTLFIFLASIPRSQIVAPGRRRYLMRRALKGIVPDEVLFRKSKWFGAHSQAVLLRDAAPVVRRLDTELWCSDGPLINSAAFNGDLAKVEHGLVAEGMQMLAAISTEQWLRTLVSSGHIWPSAPTLRCRDRNEIGRSLLEI